MRKVPQEKMRARNLRHKTTSNEIVQNLIREIQVNKKVQQSYFCTFGDIL